MSTDTMEMGEGIALLSRVTCPHCWDTFPPEQILWVAEHPDLVGDLRLGADSPQRFLPSRFNIRGAALDERGFACHTLACPKCHLSVPRAFLEMPVVFFSILGTTFCGKSYFLASMTWRLRQILPKWFALSFSDADPVLNHRLTEYESLQFLNPNRDELVLIEKTATYGDLYDTVLYGDQRVNYPRPFAFMITPLEGHPHFRAATTVARVLCNYDNAGESFLPGEDTATSPVTRHLALSRFLMFLFDPTQDVRFRRLCRGITNDPQMLEDVKRPDRERPLRQETILAEVAQRVRRFAGLGQNQRHPRPLLVILPKFDAWAGLLKTDKLPTAWMVNSEGLLAAVCHDTIEMVSQQLRKLLWKVAPELISVAEGFASQVLYLPVSATGCSPQLIPGTKALGFRPRDIKPQWAEVPLLYAMSRWMQGLVPYRKAPTEKNKSTTQESP